MLLSKADILRLRKKGFATTSFVRYDKNGYAFLRNREGCCVFFDENVGCCRVYLFRPGGCRVYPVIFDEEKGIVIDSLCKSHATISEKEKMLRGRRVIRLLRIIDGEAQK